MTSLLIPAALTLYVVTFFLALSALKKRAHEKTVGKAILLTAWSIGLVFHGLSLILEIGSAGSINLYFFNILSLISFLVTLLLYISLYRQPVEHLMVVVIPVTILSIALAAINGASENVTEPVDSFIQLHVITSLLAYSVLSLAAIQAVLLFFQDHQLHHHQPGALVRVLPSLRWMEHSLFQMITLGFLLLSLALISGFVFLEDMFLQHLVHKTVLSIIAWLVLGTLLWGRWKSGWRGRTAIRWTLGGYAFLVLAYLGTKLVLELILHKT